MHINNKLSRPGAVLAGLVACLLTLPALAQELDIADKPLFVTNNVPPNIVLAVDDSGSMDSEVIFETNDGALWWNTSARSFVGEITRGDETFIAPRINESGGANGTWKKYVYLFPNGTGTGNRIYQDSSNDHYAIPPIPQFAYARSPDFNKAYFDPYNVNADTGAIEPIIYRPWIDPQTGGRLPAADSENAQSDPIEGNFTFDLTQTLTQTICSDSGNRTFRMFDGMILPAGSRTGDNCQPSNSEQAINSTTNQRIGYFPATFYLAEELPGSFGYTAEPLSGQAPDGSRLFGYEIRLINFSNGEDVASYQSMMQNFANWFQYYRKRHLAVRGGIVESFANVDFARVGSCTINNRNNLNMLDLSVPAERRSFYDTIYSYGGNSGGTPNRQAMRHLGDQIATNDDIIQESCQQNFAVLFTDGYATIYTGAGVGNTDGDNGPPFADTDENTMADIGMYFYETLHTLGRAAGFDKGLVNVPGGCPSPSLDCNRNLHMVTFGVTLGQQGRIFGVDEDATADPFTHPPDWSVLDFGERGPEQIDDLWHATINSRGQLLNAQTPRDIADQFGAALANIESRTGSASALSFNSRAISAESRLFQASFSSGRWSGDLVSRSISDGSGNGNCTPFNNGSGDDVGILCGTEWSAATELDERGAANDRTILTRINGDPAAFRANSFPADYEDALNLSLLEYLRGSRSLEQSRAPNDAAVKYRNRDTILGDIVNSSPVYVGEPSRIRYPVDWRDALNEVEATPEDGVMAYRNPAAGTDFIRSQANRTPTVYVGANDGMLHGFDADTGEERLAFIPEAVLTKLPALAELDYDHEFFVDGSPIVGDAVINRGNGAQWRSVLVSGLRTGGKSVFALDVTDPEDFSEAEPGDTVMWEFTDNDDLGFTFSEPAIVRLHSGGWAAIFGNGYNSDNESAVLFVVDLATGTLIKKIDTRATPGNGNPPTSNGLSSVSPVDLDGDFLTDYVYAGDLYGNVWKFDLTSTNTNNWAVGFGTAAAPEPLFTARDADDNRQPITIEPQVGAHPFGLEQGVMVYFGTGKYFENADSTPRTDDLNSFYGIWDFSVFSVENSAFETNISNGFPRSRLTTQSILQTVGANGSGFRIVSDNVVQYQQTDDEAAADSGANKRGWVLDLSANSGEMVVTDATLRGGNVLFSTLIPSNITCEVGGTGFFMIVDAETGGRTDSPVLDVNGDRKFNDNDRFDNDGERVGASGRGYIGGAPGQAGIISTFGLDFAVFLLTNGNDASEVLPSGIQEGRRTWQELRR